MPALPKPIVTWRHSVNITTGEANDLEHRQRLLWELKERLVGHGTWTNGHGSAASVATPWTVVAGSDASTAEPIDMWTAFTDLTWDTNGNPHSWLVLEHSTYFGENNPLQLLLDCSQVDADQRNAALGISLSRAGFTGLDSVENKPTATDEREITMPDGDTDVNGWQGANLSDSTHRNARLHVQMSDDGRHFRVHITRIGLCVARWDLQPVLEAPGGWIQPYLFQVLSLNALAEHNTWSAAYSSNARARYYGSDSSLGDIECVAEMPHAGSPLTPAIDLPANSFDGTVRLRPVELRGVDGVNLSLNVTDLWWGNSGTATGTHAPDDGTRQFAKFGDLLVPWNGSTLIS